MKKLVKVKARPKAPVLTEDDVVSWVEQAGERGITARELAKQLGHKDAIHSARALSRLKHRLRSEHSPCADAKTHHALQESRYWLRKDAP